MMTQEELDEIRDGLSDLPFPYAALVGKLLNEYHADKPRPKRVYDINPDVSRGERLGIKYRAFSHPITPVIYDAAYRVEFDDDADEGMATIHGYLKCGDVVVHNHSMECVQDVLTGKPIKYTVRGYCRMRLKSEPSTDNRFVFDANGNYWPTINTTDNTDATPTAIVGLDNPEQRS
jgi:hypothetical protein